MKWITRILRLFVASWMLFSLNPGAVLGASIRPAVVAHRRDDLNRTVYITRTGKRYHGPNCRYLRQSRIPIKLKDAIAEGYTACHVCGGR